MRDRSISIDLAAFFSLYKERARCKQVGQNNDIIINKAASCFIIKRRQLQQKRGRCRPLSDLRARSPPPSRTAAAAAAM